MTEPKFNIGDQVRVDHHNDGSWTGEVKHRACVGGDGEWEYEVTNAPIYRPYLGWHPLAWESEMTLIQRGDEQ